MLLFFGCTPQCKSRAEPKKCNSRKVILRGVKAMQSKYVLSSLKVLLGLRIKFRLPRAMFLAIVKRFWWSRGSYRLFSTKGTYILLQTTHRPRSPPQINPTKTIYRPKVDQQRVQGTNLWYILSVLNGNNVCASTGHMDIRWLVPS